MCGRFRSARARRAAIASGCAGTLSAWHARFVTHMRAGRPGYRETVMYAAAVMTGLAVFGWLPTAVILAVSRDEGALIGLPLIAWPLIGVTTAVGGWMIANRSQQSPLRRAILGLMIAAAFWMAVFALVTAVGVLVSGRRDALELILLGPFAVGLGGLPPAIIGATAGVTLAERRMRRAR